MFSLKLIWFSNFIGYFYLIHLSCLDGVLATHKNNCKCDKFESSFQAGVNRPCSKNIRISKITNNFIELAEEPFYDGDSVYFVDVSASSVYRYCIKTGKYYYAKVGNESVSVIIPFANAQHQFFITYGDYLAFLIWDGTSKNVSLQKLFKPDPKHPWPNYFINDAKVAHTNGALFFYTEPEIFTTITAIPRHESTLFTFYNGTQKTQLTNLDFGNGLGFDGNWFYFSDSLQNLTFKSLYNPTTNSIENIRILLNYADMKIPGFPDSLTLDDEGFVWVACNGGSRIVKVDPRSGQVVCSVQFPVKTLTNLCFGKCPNTTCNKLDCIYATSLSNEENKLSGAFFLVEGVGSTGVEPDKLQFKKLFRHNHNG